MRPIITWLYTASVLFGSTEAASQSIHQEAFWRSPSQAIKINNALPASCDQHTANAAATMNSMGVRFQLTGAAQNFTSTYYAANQDPGFVNIQDASGLSVIMRTQLWQYSGTPPTEALDATILVDAGRIYYAGTSDVQQPTDFYCGTYLPSGGIGQQIDYQSAMTHEFGHVFGLGHRTDGTTGPCLMTTYLRAGEIKRNYCSDERALMLGFYGAR